MKPALFDARSKLGLTQAEVAKAIGTSEQRYQVYEYGRSEPRVRRAIRIARALDTTVEQLFNVGDALTDLPA